MTSTEACWIAPRKLRTALWLSANGARPFAGGTALLGGLVDDNAGQVVLDLGCLGLDTVQLPQAGAMTTVETLAGLSDWPAVARAAQLTGQPNLRRLATIGGVLASRLRTSDLAPALAAHRARVVVATPTGEVIRRSVVEQWASAGINELVLGIELGPPRRAAAFRRLALRRGPAPAIANVAVVVHDDGVERWAGAVAATPVPVDRDGGTTAEILTDHRASAAYLRQMVRVLVADAEAELQ